MKFELNEFHRNVPNEEFIADLIRVAALLQKEQITRDDYDEHGKFNSCTLQRRFRSWFAALAAAGLEKTRNLGVSREEYFENLQRVWVQLGEQPKYDQMRKPFSKYCAGAYAHHFGSWQNALKEFVKSINSPEEDICLSTTAADSSSRAVPAVSRCRRRTRRDINDRLRIRVWLRDRHKCVFCGRSPATDPGVILHVDHILPWSKGGESILENLQTLCSKCNLGKGNLEQAQ